MYMSFVPTWGRVNADCCHVQVTDLPNGSPWAGSCLITPASAPRGSGKHRKLGDPAPNMGNSSRSPGRSSFSRVPVKGGNIMAPVVHVTVAGGLPGWQVAII